MSGATVKCIVVGAMIGWALVPVVVFGLNLALNRNDRAAFEALDHASLESHERFMARSKAVLDAIERIERKVAAE